MWSLCTVLPGNDNISLTTDRHDVNCDGLLISSRFQVTAGWFFMTYWNEWKLTAALCGGEMPLKDCVMWKSFNDVYDSIYLFIQHWFDEVSRQFFFTKSHPYIIVFLFSLSQCQLRPISCSFPSSTWHYECIQSLPVKFIRADLLCDATEWCEFTSSICFCVCILLSFFSLVHHWKVVKPPSKLLYSAQKMALMLLMEVFFVRFLFQFGLLILFFVGSAVRQPTKHQEELSC